MNSELIHTEVICKVKYINNEITDDDLIFDLINAVEEISSYVTGYPEEYVFSAYDKGVDAEDLISIINNKILSDVKNIKKYAIKIYRYSHKIE